MADTGKIVEVLFEKTKEFSEKGKKTEISHVEITESKKDLAEAANIIQGKFVPKPAPSDLESSQWQSLAQNVYYYPDTVKDSVVTHVEDNIIESKLLEIRDLIKAVSKHSGSEDEKALLNQLKILPSETAINKNTVATELTCKLCSTIIYRPLKDKDVEKL